MTPGDNIRAMRKSLKMTLVQLSEKTGLSKSTISDIENNKSNPSTSTIKKIADALNTSVSSLIDTRPDFIFKDDSGNINIIECKTTKTNAFSSAQEAMEFILEQPVVMGYGGFDISKLTDKDKIEFANEILNQLKLLGYKYKRD
ncbi:MAG: helix-turn-helix domain-containing protein [Clostridium sp.]